MRVISENQFVTLQNRIADIEEVDVVDDPINFIKATYRFISTFEALMWDEHTFYNRPVSPEEIDKNTKELYILGADLNHDNQEDDIDESH